jgi:hypothetical protein
VLGAEIEERTDLRAGDLLDEAFVALRDAMRQCRTAERD